MAKQLFKLDGVKEITEKIGRITDRAKGAEAKKVFVAAAGEFAREIRHRAPVYTGTLRNAVFHGPGDPNKPNALVGVNQKKAPHAHLVEYGSVRSQPRPFLRPAAVAAAPKAAAILRAGLEKLIDTAAQ